MNVIVCGSRNWTDREMIYRVLDAGIDEDWEVWHGACPTGADAIVHEWFKAFDGQGEHPCPARWDLYGKAAGPIRNAYMLQAANPRLVVAFIEPGRRGGTRDMIQKALDSRYPPEIRIYPPKNPRSTA